MPASRRVLLGLGLVLSTSACEPAPARPGTGLAPPSRVGKQALYGDAALMPTREGERVRRELALGAELGDALAHLGLAGAYVDVELEPEVPNVVVIAEADPALGEAEVLRTSVIELATAVVPASTPASVRVWLRPGPALDIDTPDPEPPRGAALALVCLGLGLSLGVAGERLRARRR